MQQHTSEKRMRTLRQIPAREAALRVLDRCGVAAPVQALLHAQLSSTAFSRQESALTTELVYGYLRYELQLSWILGCVLPKQEKLPQSMRLILGMAAYELFYLDRVPAHASVSAAVDAVRARYGHGLSRVANGALRALIRLNERENVLAPAFYAQRIHDPLDRLAIQYSLPRWILELWVHAYGLDRAAACTQAAARVPWPCVRVNTAYSEWQTLRMKLADLGEAFAISGVRFAPGNLPECVPVSLARGQLSLQGGGSQLLLHALRAAQWKGPVWDACAGHGGKTLALIELGLPVMAASDTFLPRLRDLRAEAQRLHLTSPPLLCASAAAPAIIGRPQTILLDVPCSGLGTLARHPDLKKLRVPDQLAGLIRLQRAMLDAAWTLLPTGGKIAYVTCTVNPDENETQITHFLQRNADADIEQQWSNAPDNFGTDIMFGAIICKRYTQRLSKGLGNRSSASISASGDDTAAPTWATTNPAA